MSKNWKELTDRMIDAAGSRKEVAAVLGVHVNDLSNWCNPNHERVIPVDHMVDLDALADRADGVIKHRFLRELARTCGFELVAMEDDQPDTAQLLDAVAEVVKHSADLNHETIAALRDGKLSPNEARSLESRMGMIFNGLHSVAGALS